MADGMHFLRSGTLEHKREMLDHRISTAGQERLSSHKPAVHTSSSLAARKNMFAERAASHQKKMASNPFSGSYVGGRPPTLNKDDPNYGKPVAGSKSERRGLQAAARINAEVAVLCDMIYQEGERYEDGTAVIAFGDLFQIYTRISNKVVGILLRARKHGLVSFEGEVLFQGRDDKEPIALLKSIKAIKSELAEDKEFQVGVCHRAVVKEDPTKEDSPKEDVLKEDVLKENTVKEDAVKADALKDVSSQETTMKEEALKENT